MFKYISFGTNHSYNKYIFLSVFFLLLNFMAFGINYNDSFLEIKIFPYNKKSNESNEERNNNDHINNGTLNINNIKYNDIEINKYYNIFNHIKEFQNKDNSLEQMQPYFSNHKYIHLIYCYFFTFLFGLVYNFISSENDRVEEYLLSSENYSLNSLNSSYCSNKFMLLFIIFLWVIMDFFIDFYNYCLKDLDFWFFELIMISFISTKISNFKLYSHQKLAILFNLFLSFTKISIIILSLCDPKKNEYLW